MNKKNNRKAQFTQRIFQETILELLEQKPMARISVSEICVAADMNRSTFYAHYEDQYALLRQIEEDFLKRLYESMAENNAKKYPQRLEQYLTYIQDHKVTYLILVREDKEFDKKMLSVHSKIFHGTTKRDSDEVSADETFRLEFLVGGVMFIIERWLTESTPIGIPEMTEKLYQIAETVFG